MDIYDSRYFLLNKKLLTFTGLWPYQEKGTKYLIRFNTLLIIISSLIPQLIGLYLNFGVNKDRVFEHIGVVFYLFILGFKVIAMYISENKMKAIYENIAANWGKITDKRERDILCEYSERGRILTIGYTGYLLNACTMFISLPTTPMLADIFFPLNETRPVYYILNGEYLVDAKENYIKIFMFEAFVCSSTILVYSAHDTIYVAFVEHCLGIFAIVRSRLQSLTDFSFEDNRIFGSKQKNNVQLWIIKTIQLHKDIMEFADILERTYSPSFLIILGASTGAITFTSILIIIHLGDRMQMCRHSMILLGNMMHLFFISWPGQKLIDHSAGIYEDAYMNEWYHGTNKIQKLLAFMTLRCRQPCQLTCGGIYVLNFINFAVVLKTSASYITVFSSFR